MQNSSRNVPTHQECQYATEFISYTTTFLATARNISTVVTTFKNLICSKLALPLRPSKTCAMAYFMQVLCRYHCRPRKTVVMLHSGVLGRTCSDVCPDLVARELSVLIRNSGRLRVCQVSPRHLSPLWRVGWAVLGHIARALYWISFPRVLGWSACLCSQVTGWPRPGLRRHPATTRRDSSF